MSAGRRRAIPVARPASTAVADEAAPSLARPVATLMAILVATSGCWSSVVWLGKSPDRSRAVVVLQDMRGQRVQVDGRDGEVFAAVGVDALSFSPDGKRLAYPARTPAGWVVVIDGAAGPRFEGVAEIVWSGDSQHVAYAAARDERWRVILDGREGPSLEALRARSLRLSHDGAHIAYAGDDGGRVVVVVDGVRSAPYDAIGKLSLGGDGRCAFVARRGNEALVIADGEERGPYEDVADLSFSPTGRRLGWLARKGGGWRAIVDGDEGEAHDRVSTLVWAPHTEAFAYAVGTGATERVVVSGLPGGAGAARVSGPPFEGVLPASVVFDHTGRHIAYAARRRGAWHVIVDAASGEPYEGLEAPMFVGDSSAVAFVARRAEATFVVVDGRQGPVHADATGLVLSRDGRRYLHLSRAGMETAVIEGVVEGGPCGEGRCSPRVTRTMHHDVVVGGTLVFGELGAHSGYLAGQALGRRLFLMIDGERAGELDMDELMAGLILEPDLSGALTGDSRALARWIRAEVTLTERAARARAAGGHESASARSTP